MTKLLTSPIDAGKVRLANIELLESKYVVKEKLDGKTVKKTVFKRKWKFYVENRRTNNIRVSFHLTLLSRDGTKSENDEFVIETVETFTSVGSVYHGAEEDLKILLESMRIEEEGKDVEIVPLEIDLGYTGSYSTIERTGIQVGKFIGKVSKKTKDYFSEDKDQ